MPYLPLLSDVQLGCECVCVCMCVSTQIVSRLLDSRRRPMKINTNVHNVCMCVITEAAEIRINGMGGGGAHHQRVIVLGLVGYGERRAKSSLSSLLRK